MALTGVPLALSHVRAFPRLHRPRTGDQLPQISVAKCRRHSNEIHCMAKTVGKPNNQAVVRCCADYGPTVWEYEYIQSLTSNYVGETCERKAATMKEEVRMMLEMMATPLEKLELIDTVQRLGVSYHFEPEIKGILDLMYNGTDWLKETDLHGAALRFRLFRQHGYIVPEEVFEKFKDKFGNFKESLSEDTKGLLSLYEASFHGFDGESTLDEARDFARKHLLKENQKKKTRDPNVAMLVSHALELPIHWTMQRFEGRWFIDAYGMREDANYALLNFAKLDFNMVQAIHQEDLKHVSRWWENLGWNKKLPFARDRLVECYLWSLGEVYEPQSEFQNYRRMATRVNQLVTCIDDVYDIYGTLEELQLFTDAFLRWDVNLAENLPDYMKICFLGNVNSINELGYEALKEHGVHALPYLIKVWADLCGRYMKEARWFHGGHVPPLEEYLNNGWISVAIPMMAVHGYFLSANHQSNFITKEGLEAVKNYHDLIKWPSMVVRLANDLGTSKNEMERGDNLKTIQIYMHETGASLEEAHKHVNSLIVEAWKKINAARIAPNCPFGRKYVDIATNLARSGQYMYQYGDAHGHHIRGKNKDRVSLLLVDPVPLCLD